MSMKIALISLTNQGDLIGKKLKKDYDMEIFTRSFVKENGFRKVCNKVFDEFDALVFSSSTGIAVRAIAPLMKSKTTDPAVIIIDSSGKFVISLISGHLGGANELAEELALKLGAIPVITTATDGMGIIAPDVIARDNRLKISSMKVCKEIAALLVEEKNILFIDDENEIENLGKGYCSEKDLKENSIKAHGVLWITNKANTDERLKEKIKELCIEKDVPILRLIRTNIVLGIGCRKNHDVESMYDKVVNRLNKYNIDKKAIKVVATVEIKAEEKAILELNRRLQSELKIFKIHEIREIHNKYEGSDFVEKTIGVRAVCEPCVELSGGTLLTDKIKDNGMTICIGKLN